MKLYKYSILILLAFVLMGCPRSPSLENEGRWTRIDSDYVENNQFELDKYYCNGQSSQVHIPEYNPSPIQPSSYNVKGTINSYNQGQTTSSNYTGIVTNNNSFSQGFNQSFSSTMNLMAVNAANARADNRFNTCMDILGWEKISYETARFSKSYYANFTSKMLMLSLKIQNTNELQKKSSNGFNRTVLDFKKLPEYYKNNPKVKNTIDKNIQLLENYIKLNADTEMKANALYSLSKIYLDGIFLKRDYDKYIELLKKSADLNYDLAQSEIASLYYKGEVYSSTDLSTFNKNNSLKNMSLALYYYSQLAKKYIPKEKDRTILAGISTPYSSDQFVTHLSKYSYVIEARYIIGVELLKGEYLEPNEELGIEYITSSAKRGYNVAQMELAYYYFKLKKYKKTLFWLRKAIVYPEHSFEKFSAYSLSSLLLHEKKYYYKLSAKMNQEMNLAEEHTDFKIFLDNYDIKNIEKLMIKGCYSSVSENSNISGILKFKKFKFEAQDGSHSLYVDEIPILYTKDKLCVLINKKGKFIKKYTDKFIISIGAETLKDNYVFLNNKLVKFDKTSNNIAKVYNKSNISRQRLSGKINKSIEINNIKVSHGKYDLFKTNINYILGSDLMDILEDYSIIQIYNIEQIK